MIFGRLDHAHPSFRATCAPMSGPGVKIPPHPTHPFLLFLRADVAHVHGYDML